MPRNFNNAAQITDRGYTPHEAVAIVRKALPDIEHWMLWLMEPDPSEYALRGMLGDGIHTNGKIGSWRWERVPCDMPDIHTWGGKIAKRRPGFCWMGLIHVTGSKGEDFYLFSYQRPDLKYNVEYLVSTGDRKMLRRFTKAISTHFGARSNKRILTVHVQDGPNMVLDLRKDERPFLPDDTLNDIEQQTDQFFGNAALYKKMDIPYRRGLLFAGAPGTGKTMMVRHLMRQSYLKHKVNPNYLTVNRRTDDDDIHRFFKYSGDDNKPFMLVIEEIDSLFYECQVSRSNLLAMLDGISPLHGAMLIATTNNPDRIDAALLHRPSRFDRIWTFPLPDKLLRFKYMKDTFMLEGQDALIGKLAGATDGWTFAYIKELRVTASFIALQSGHESLTAESLKEAFKLLNTQFQAGRKNHPCNTAKPQSVGFGSSSHDLAASLDDH